MAEKVGDLLGEDTRFGFGDEVVWIGGFDMDFQVLCRCRPCWGVYMGLVLASRLDFQMIHNTTEEKGQKIKLRKRDVGCLRSIYRHRASKIECVNCKDDLMPTKCMKESSPGIKA